MCTSLRHISASLLLALYLPLALALPFFHNHSTGVEFGDVLSYSAQHDHEEAHGHAGECAACKFASSHWMPSEIAQCTPAVTAVLPAVPLPRIAPPAPAGLPSPRGPPALS